MTRGFFIACLIVSTVVNVGGSLLVTWVIIPWARTQSWWP